MQSSFTDGTGGIGILWTENVFYLQVAAKCDVKQVILFILYFFFLKH